ncbi:hypothetical protein MUK42_17253, partial [Musa troglodytarum]
MAAPSPLMLGLGLGLGRGVGASKPVFTFMQLQELEHQALIYKYMAAGLPSQFSSSSPSGRALRCRREAVMGYGSLCLDYRNIMEPEPGRCRRTDGKKWRCSRDVVPNQKYCERHMHRGRNRPRKPVEAGATTSITATSTQLTADANTGISGGSRVSPPGQRLSHARVLQNDAADLAGERHRLGRNGGRSPGKKKQRRQRGAAGGSIAEQPELGSSRCHRGGCRPEKGDFSMFRTKSALTSRQNSFLSSRKENGPDLNHAVGVPGSAGTDDRVNKSVPAGMYFAALRGPELDQVRDCEDILLPKGEVWPFLLRFPIGCFGMCLGLGSQAILWRALASSPAMAFLHVTPDINLVLWLLALAVFVFVSITYILKCVFYFEAICREYYHPVRVNFFFAPWIACMFLAIGAPARLAPKQPHPAIWCTLIAPVFVLELKIYGQWLSGGQRRLCKVANPSCHLSVVGNFVGAILAAKVGWEEAGKLLWAVGLAHYLCLFVTPVSAAADHPGLAQGAAPRVLHVYCDAGGASIAWSAIYGSSTPWRGPSTSSPSSSTAPSS